MEKRLALVFGNANYQYINKLRNTLNDARDMKAKLESLGFEVMLGLDCTCKQMQDMHAQYLRKLPDYRVGLLYYSGHGAQYKGDNQLVPVDYTGRLKPGMDPETWLRKNCFSVEEHLHWISRFEETKVNICILDACRTNPMPEPQRGCGDDDATQYLEERFAPISSQPRGTIISFATGPDHTSSDGAGRNGLYTGELLRWIDKPRMKIEDMFKAVRQRVEVISHRSQITWEHSSLINDFYFNPGKGEGVRDVLPADAAADSGKRIRVACPQCAAQVTLEAGETETTCPYCRALIERP